MREIRGYIVRLIDENGYIGKGHSLVISMQRAKLFSKKDAQAALDYEKSRWDSEEWPGGDVVPVVLTESPDVYVCCREVSCNHGTCRGLPLGRTCADCTYFVNCEDSYGAMAGNRYCQFFPRQFKAMAKQ